MSEASGLKILSWEKRQSARLNHVKVNRLRRGYDPQAPLALDGFTTPAAPTKEDRRLRQALGARNAEAFLQRVGEYCAKECPHNGEIRVRRSLFGRCVLSRDDDVVGRALGEKVFDALVEAQLATPLRDVTNAKAVMSRTAPGDVTTQPAVPSPAARILAQINAPKSRAGDVTNAPAVTSPTPERVTSPAPPGDVTNQEPVTSPETAPPAPEHAPPSASGAQHAHDLRAEGAREVSSLVGRSGDVTGDAPDQTREQEQESSPRGAANGEGTAVGRVEGEALAARLLACRRELVGMSVDVGDERRAAARELLHRTPEAERDASWCGKAETVMARPKRARLAVAAGSVVCA